MSHCLTLSRGVEALFSFFARATPKCSPAHPLFANCVGRTSARDVEFIPAARAFRPLAPRLRVSHCYHCGYFAFPQISGGAQTELSAAMADCWIADKSLIIIHIAALTGKPPWGRVIEDRGLGLDPKGEKQGTGVLPSRLKQLQSQT